MLRIPKTTHNFQTIRYNSPVTTTFEIFNEDDNAVTIESLSSSCGCTTPVLDINPIPAKGKSTLSITYNANSRGNNFKTAYITESGGKQHQFHISANVK